MDRKDSDPLAPKMTTVTEMSQKLNAQMEESAKLDEVIRKNLEGLGYGK
jgi:type I restriction enzyme M protein